MYIILHISSGSWTRMQSRWCVKRVDCKFPCPCYSELRWDVIWFLKTWRNRVTLWSKYFVTLRGSYYRGFTLISQRERWGEHVGRNGSKHVRGMINHQLQKFTPPWLVSWVTVIYFAPWGEGEQRRVLMPLGLSLLTGGRHVYKLGRGVFMVTWFSLVRSCLGQQSPSTDR